MAVKKKKAPKKKTGQQIMSFKGTAKKPSNIRRSKKAATTRKKVAKAPLLKKLPASLKGTGVTLAQVNKARREGGIVLKAVKRQTGSSVKFLDNRKKAKAPGKRISANGNVYYETRKNRSDKKGSNS